MKCLSVRQPFASLIFDAVLSPEPIGPDLISKTIETRTWATKYRGPLLIIASMQWHKGHVLTAKQGRQKINEHARRFKECHFPTGMAIGVVDLVDCRPMTADDEVAACCELYDGAFSWVLENPRKIVPFEFKGRLLLWDYTGPEIVFV